MYKKILLHSLVAGVLAAIAANIYYRIYFFASQADFSMILNIWTMSGLAIATCFVAGLLYWAMIYWLKQKGEIVFNFLFSILSFAAVMIPISITLPLKIEFPELFPALAVPMVFFPALAWYTVHPLFVIR